MGYCQLKEEHKNYYKVLVLRNPYKKFISGFLQDCVKDKQNIYRHIDLTFEKYCHFLKDIHDKPQITYFLDEKGNKKYMWHYFTNDSPVKCKLDGHIKTIYCELKNILEFFDYKFDKVTITEELDQCLNEIKKKFNITVDVVKGNIKEYQSKDIDIINTKVSDIANGSNYPKIERFYNENITKIVSEIYEEDFDLLKRLNMDYCYKDFPPHVEMIKKYQENDYYSS
jgi:hypothetical protein